MTKDIIPRVIALLLAAILITGFVASCSASNKMSQDDAAYAEENSSAGDMGQSPSQTGAYYDYDYSEEEKDAAIHQMPSPNTRPPKDDSGQTITDTRKIIKTVNLELETKRFNDAVAQITASATANGGYIEYSYVSGESLQSKNMERNAKFTVRIPASVLDAYVSGLGGNFNVLSKTENASDITDSYFDAEARLKSLQTQEERLLAMLEGATELQYMLQLEQTLADVRYQIESYYSTIKRYDSQVSLSTVSISLYEVIEYQQIIEKPKTYTERLGQAIKRSWHDFIDGLKDFSVDFVYAFPTLLVLVVFITGAVLIVRKILRHKKSPGSGK